MKRIQAEIEIAAKKFWRTLVRVDNVNRNTVGLVIPGWDHSKVVKLKLDTFPEDIRPLLVKNKRLHCRCNVGAEKMKDLVFENWERD